MFKDKPKFWLTFRILWIMFAAPFAIFFILYLLISFGALGFMPDFEDLENPKSSQAAQIISSNNVLLGKYYRQNRTTIKFENLSPHVVNALIATEDARFYEHNGIDGWALGRAVWGVLTFDSKGGGSTISQQLAKNLFPRDTTSRGFFLAKAANMLVIKVKEWITAVRLERNYTKHEIMLMYLNTVTFGSETFGIEAASKTFFSVPPDSLKIEQAALLVGLLKAPSYYSPVISEKTKARCLVRRNVVLGQMEKYDYITENQYDSLSKRPLQIDYSPQSHRTGIATYFREYLRTVMTSGKPNSDDYIDKQKFKDDSTEWETNPLYGWCTKNKKSDGSEYDLYKDGLKIYTTIDARMQRYAEESMVEHMKGFLQPAFFKEKKGRKKGPFSWQVNDEEIKKIYEASIRRSERYRVLKEAGYSKDSIKIVFNTPARMKVFSWRGEIDTVMTPFDSIKYYKYFLNAGFMAMEPQTGFVKAYVGGLNYEHFKYDHINIARRQVGSTFKPFLYTLAMMQYAPCFKVPNVAVSFDMPPGMQPAVYTPKLSEDKHLGEMVTLRYGLSNSLNQISAWVMKQYSPQAVVDIARKMGVRSPLDPVYSLCVGSAEVKLSEMVSAYSTFVNNGIYTEPIYVTRIEDKDGNVISRFVAKKDEAISAETAYRMVNMMQGVCDMGTGARLRYKFGLKNQIAGKTGTTNNNSDGWFIGYVPQLIAGAWVGGEERSIHFDQTAMGQGASMALPIWGLFMQKVYADKSIGILQSATFERPANVSLDCSSEDQQIINEADIPLEGEGGSTEEEKLF
jgi:penicillin-binding protein 1A